MRVTLTPGAHAHRMKTQVGDGPAEDTIIPKSRKDEGRKEQGRIPVAPATRIPIALYARVSSVRQDVELSIGTQLDEMRALAKSESRHVVREYKDEAKTGRTIDRREFQRMLNDVESAPGTIRELWVWDLARFARDRTDAVMCEMLLEKHGVKLRSLKEPIEDSPEGELLKGMLQSMNHYFGKNLGRQVKRAQDGLREAGYWTGGYLPFGIGVETEEWRGKLRKRLIPDPVTAPVAREVFRRFAAGDGPTKIARWLNDAGHLTTRKRRWTIQTIHHLVSCKPLLTAGVVDVDLWTRCQKRATRMPAEAQRRGDYLLSGLAWCTSCGGPLVGASAFGASKRRYGYYICSHQKRLGRATCNALSISQGILETQVLRMLAKHALSKLTVESVIAQLQRDNEVHREEIKRRLPETHAALASARAAIDALYRAAEDPGAIGETLNLLAPRIEERQAQIARLEVELSDLIRHDAELRQFDLPTRSALIQEVREFRKILLTAPPEAQRPLVARLVERIEVNTKERKVLLKYLFPLPGTKRTEERAPLRSEWLPESDESERPSGASVEVEQAAGQVEFSLEELHHEHSGFRGITLPFKRL